jgi:hypothetical protein
VHKTILLLLLLLSAACAVEALPADTNSTSRVLLLDNSTMPLPTAKATLIVGPLTLNNGLYVGDFKVKVFPYFFKSDRGRLAINASPAALEAFNEGKAVTVTGTATSTKNGVVRQIEITATPKDSNRGTVSLWFMAGKQKMIFTPAYHFAGKTVADANSTRANILTADQG